MSLKDVIRRQYKGISISDLDTFVDDFSFAASGSSGGSPSWSDITGKPSVFTPSTHGHSIADTSLLQTALDGKALSGHDHTGVYEPVDATILKGADIGVSVSAQHGHPYASDSHNHTGVYETANSNIQVHVTAAHAPSTAEQNVNADWNAGSGDAQILNKPDLSSLHTRLHSITGGSDHTFPGGSTFLKADGTFASPPGGSEAFPVGSVFIAVVSTNPNTLLGYGTWSAFAAGRVLVGIDAGQTEFDTVEETGGAKTHTLAESEIPSHTHVQNAHNHAVTDPGHTHLTQRYPTATGSSSGFTIDTSMSGTLADNTLPTKTNTTGVTVGNQTPTNQNAGGGAGHNNLQPYIVVYMWRRTA